MMTTSNMPRLGTIKACSGDDATEESEVKARWKEYTEKLYKKDDNMSPKCL